MYENVKKRRNENYFCFPVSCNIANFTNDSESEESAKALIPVYLQYRFFGAVSCS